jgi:hypothetical protein
VHLPTFRRAASPPTRHPRRRAAKALAAASLVASGLAAASAVDARPAAAVTGGSVTFSYVGRPQYFNIPTGITEVLVEAWGAQGDGANGGKGGYVRTFLTVVPNQTLQVNVGGAGRLLSGGWNGGGSRGDTGWGVPGGGGGASDIRRGGTTLSHRVIVAGGGGGGADSKGGSGGYPIGTKAGDNGANDVERGAEGGLGGAQDRGGWGGYGWCGIGETGVYGIGGKGGSGLYGGGGGGGGYYGGGGGGVGCSWGGAAGGGGSSWTEPAYTNGSMYAVDARPGDGLVVITWSPDEWPDSLTRPGAIIDPTGTVRLDPLHGDIEVAWFDIDEDRPKVLVCNFDGQLSVGLTSADALAWWTCSDRAELFAKAELRRDGAYIGEVHDGATSERSWALALKSDNCASQPCWDVETGRGFTFDALLTGTFRIPADATLTRFNSTYCAWNGADLVTCNKSLRDGPDYPDTD